MALRFRRATRDRLKSLIISLIKRSPVREEGARKGRIRPLIVIVGDVLLALVLLYAAVGLAVGVRFASVVAAGFNGRASVGSFPFRLLLIPGAALLWPLVLKIGADGVAAKPPHGLSPPMDALASGHAGFSARGAAEADGGEARIR